MELLNSRHHSVSGTPATFGGANAPSTNDLSVVEKVHRIAKFLYRTTANLCANNILVANPKVTPTRCVTCGLLCVKQIALSEANYGRKFYCCKSKYCKFFVCWEDAIPTTSVGDNSLVTTTKKKGLKSAHSPIRCVTCGLLCIKQIAISKANYGRKFYCCKSKDCKFFVCWEDTIPTTNVGNNNLVTTTSKMGLNSGDSSIRCATCGLLCDLITIAKGPNKGRKFYCCESEDCVLFVCWQDSIPATSGGDNGLATTASIMGANSNKGDSPIQCATCGFLCVLKTVNAGPKQGRKFYSCEKTEDCMFFVRWEDSIPTTSGDDNNLATTTSIMGVNSNNGDSPIQCAVCGFLCVLRAVIAGPNQGRIFYSCEKTKDCMFFVCWQDSIPTTSGGDNGLATTASIMGANSNKGHSPIQCAVCGFLCVLRAVIAGPNQGRKFYSCEKTEDCMFFVRWEDSIPTTSGDDNSLATTTSIMGVNSNNGHSPIQCAVCGFLCVLRAVIVGPNQGRNFYSCENTKDCMFFVCWQDSIPTTSGGDNGLATTASIMGANSNKGHSPIQCAVCGFLCVLRAVIAGPNQGRNFYSCEKTKDCMFFVRWEDSIPTTRDGGSSSDTSTS